MQRCLSIASACASMWAGPSSSPEEALLLSRQLRWRNASEAHLGDPAPMISEAEAFARHNANDCLAAHHEKDYRVLKLFARLFMQGRGLLIIRITSQKLRAACGSADHAEIISIVELLAFVAFASSDSSGWRGELVLYVTDDENVS